MTPDTLTGWPESFVGENLAFSAAWTAASRRIVGPLVAVAETTLPVSSRTTSTETRPDALMRLAASGSTGCGKVIAVPFSTPPEIGFRIGRGAGGGSSRLTRTSWGVITPPGVFTSAGLTIWVAELEAAGTSGASVGLFLSRDLFAALAFGSGLLGVVFAIGLAVTGATGGGAAAGVPETVFSMFSSR